MRPITKIILHCSATPEGRDVTIEDIDRWHRKRGYDGCGYHYVIYRDGTIHWGRPVERAGAHTRNYNLCSIGICYIGGLDAKGCPKDTRTEEQHDVMLALCRMLLCRFPKATIHGHNEFDNKACPCFDVAAFVRELYSDSFRASPECDEDPV